jgi:hypothetical protein
MKNLKLNMQREERTITAICPTVDGVEWSSLTIKDGQRGEIVTTCESLLSEAISTDGFIEYADLPLSLRNALTSEIILALPSHSMSLETATLPTVNEDEMRKMSQFFLDKKIPFAIDRMAFDCETLSQSDQESVALLGAAQISLINRFTSYSSKKHEVKSIDSRICGWLQLIPFSQQLPQESNECLIIDDGFEVHLVMRNQIQIHWIRPLYIDFNDQDAAEQLAFELTYSFQQHAIEIPNILSFWRYEPLSEMHQNQIQKTIGKTIQPHSISDMPALSVGLIERFISPQTTLNFIPASWIEQQKQRVIHKRFLKYTTIMAIIWLLLFALFFTIYSVRNAHLNRLLTEANEIAPAAKIAKENSEKLKALQLYTDRSQSSLECLRELTLLLPAGDIEFTSYNYSKSKGVTLRGTAINDDIVYEFFKKLASSPLFDELKNQSVNTRSSKGIQRAVFSVSLNLPNKGEI